MQRRVSTLLNEPPYGRQNQTNRRYMFRKTSAMVHSVEIALLFMCFSQTFEARTRVNQANIAGL